MSHSNVQSVLVPNSMGYKRAVAWLDKHAFIHPKVDFKRNFMRFRQFDPSPSHKYRMRVLNNGVELVINIAKGGGIERVHAVLIPKSLGIDYAAYWIDKHGFNASHVVEMPNFIRFRQFKKDPAHVYRARQLPNGIVFIMNVA